MLYGNLQLPGGEEEAIVKSVQVGGLVFVRLAMSSSRHHSTSDDAAEFHPIIRSSPPGGRKTGYTRLHCTIMP